MNNVRLYVGLTFMLMPFVYLATIYSGLPDIVPIHFDIHGVADGWGPKYLLWILPGIGIPLVLLVNRAITRGADSEKQRVMALITLAFVSTLMCYLIYTVAHDDFNAIGGLAILLGLFFAVFGNYLPVLRRNHVMGIRVPPTMRSPGKWRKTHRFAGLVYLVSGLIMIVAGIAFAAKPAMIITVATSILAGVVSIGYAYSLPDEPNDLV